MHQNRQVTNHNKTQQIMNHTSDVLYSKLLNIRGFGGWNNLNVPILNDVDRVDQ